ncbi:natterin-3-like isoform X1 [Etheostoma cragini]|uniref:natterin-3-like isoform X1 n=1 Tax=Etheostoma cragini TaxID=417921 RepID=UPI00155E6E1C|nr:natterin-3-like isoform X1 [Etheostoma cragini]
MMKLPVLLVLALPVLYTEGSCMNRTSIPQLNCLMTAASNLALRLQDGCALIRDTLASLLYSGKTFLLNPGLEDRVPKIPANRSTNQALPTPPEIEDKLGRVPSIKFDKTNLEWQIFNGSIPNGAVYINNQYVGRYDYVCQFFGQAGFYNPSMGPYCYYSFKGKEYVSSLLWPFEILVNKDNFELMEWKDGSYGSVPQNAVRTCSGCDIYVGKNEYGLGKVVVKDKVFYLPYNGDEYWYYSYQVLSISKDIYSEDMFDVKYKTDGVKVIDYPPETMCKSFITNYECQSVTATATVSKTIQVEQTWATSFSITLGVKTSVTAQIPSILSTGIEFSLEKTLQFTEGTTYTESTTHTVSVEVSVPPNHSCRVSLVGYKYGADIPYSARLKRTYINGGISWTPISGNYSSAQMGEVRGVVDPCKPVPDPTPCP